MRAQRPATPTLLSICPHPRRWGEIEDAHLVTDDDTGKSKGFAFVKYEDFRSAVLAVDNMNGARLLGRLLRVDHKLDYRPPKKAEEDEPDAAAAAGDAPYKPGAVYEGVDTEGGFSLDRGVDVFGGGSAGDGVAVPRSALSGAHGRLATAGGGVDWRAKPDAGSEAGVGAAPGTGGVVTGGVEEDGGRRRRRKRHRDAEVGGAEAEGGEERRRRRRPREAGEERPEDGSRRRRRRHGEEKEGVEPRRRRRRHGGGEEAGEAEEASRRGRVKYRGAMPEDLQRVPPGGAAELARAAREP